MNFTEYTQSSYLNKIRENNGLDSDSEDRFNRFINFQIENNLETDNPHLQKLINERSNLEDGENTKTSNLEYLRDQARSKFWQNKTGYNPVIKMNISNDINIRAKQGIDYLVDKGLTREQAAGILGNLMQESNLDTKILGDSGTSIGLAQWRKERRDALRNFANVTGKDKFDYFTQLDFIIHELNTTEKDAFEKLKQAKTVEEASDIFSKHYERPNINFAHNDKRRNYARQFYNS